MSKKLIIGTWRITPEQNKLSFDSNDYFVEPLAMDVLLYFAKNPNKVISRDELVENVWKGRIVGDHAIYRIINQIRKILSEDIDNSYITTIRKKGYQLKQQVTWVEEDEKELNTSYSISGSNTLSSKFKSLKGKKWFVIFSLLILSYLLWYGYSYIVKSMNYNAIKPFDVIKPFSVLIGEEKDASFSPDGEFVSYSHRSQSNKNFKIYVQSIAGESPVQITKELGDDVSSSWSPDGTELVFVRHLQERCKIMKVKVEENAVPEKIIDCHASGLLNEVVWGVDDNIYFTDSFSAVDPYKIYKYSLKTSKKEQLTNPEAGKSKGDIHISLSHKEKMLAFTRDLDWGSTEVKLLDLQTKKISDLFYLNGWRKALAWSYDDENLYYIDKDNNINAYSIEYGFHKKVLDNRNTLYSISGHQNEDKLSIMTGETGIDIWGTSLDSKNLEAPFIESSEIDLFPEFANNSNDIAFMSLRSGEPQIWIKLNSGREYQLSSFSDNRGVQRIRWSPDDNYILSSVDNELYIIDVQTKEYKVIWQYQQPFRIEGANWSGDGKFIYFSSDVDGDWQIYKKAFSDTTKPIKVTDKGGYSPEFSQSGEMLYYKYHQNGIWKMELDTKLETQLIDDTNVFAYDALYPRKGGFFYISIKDSGNNINFYDLTTDNVSLIQGIENPFLDYTISNDGSQILYPKLFSMETEIKVLEKR